MKRTKQEQGNDIISIEKHNRDFSMIDNTGIRDANLSYKATGLLVFLVSHPSGWKINLSHLCNSKADGRDSVLSGLSELNDAGYLLYLRWRDSQGMWASRYIVFETPDLKEKYLERLTEEDLAKVSTPFNPAKARNQKKKAASDSTSENPQWSENGKTETEKPEMKIQRGKSEQTNNIYTNTDYQDELPRECVYLTRTREEKHTPEFRKISEPEIRASERLTQTQTINIQPVPPIRSSAEDNSQALSKKSTIKYDPALGMRPPAPRITNLIPDGDWLTETGQLDPAFIRHIAKQWQDSPDATFHKMPIEEVEVKVFGHFARNHDKLVIAWEGYSKVALRHAEGIKMRLDAEISIPESDQQQVINDGRAIASALNQPEEEKAVPSLPTQENRKPFGFVLPEASPQPKAIAPAATPQPTPEPEPIRIEPPRDDDGLAENPNAYQEYKPEHIDPGQQKANLDRLNAMIRSQLKITPVYSGQKKQRAMASFPRNLSEANEWCKDSCLRSQAVLWAKREGYAVDYSPEGVAIEIFEF